jgi:hypothetical protein
MMRHVLFFRLLKKIAIPAGLPLVLIANIAVAAAASPAYVQGSYAVPQTPRTTVTVQYPGAQTDGDLNVVIVGWNDATAQVSSVTDSNGNNYQLAVGPTVESGGPSQSIYYAKNISGDSNTVTVTFTSPAVFPDIRILEYSGIDPANPVDAVVGATGNSTTTSSGTVTTTNATDLLVGANTVESVTSNAGSGFTQRLLTTPDGDIAEDGVVTSTGTYGASAPLAYAGGWTMQMVAFRAAQPASPSVLAFVQGNNAVPATPQTSVAVRYPSAQGAGDLNVVIVGWNDTAAHVSSVKDSNGNSYQLAVGATTLSGTTSQSIYYAKNISAASAGGNSVTVTFTSPAIWPDIRILEYSGIDPANPVDVAVGASGIGTNSSSGSVTTNQARDLLVGGNTVTTLTVGAGSGFTQRLLTNPDGDIAEDQIVTNTGSYGASAPLSSPGGWVMQMVAFHVASSATIGGSNPPSNPSNPPPASSSVKLAWNANSATNDPATNTAGYKLYFGFSSGKYTQSTNVGNTTSATESNLVSGTAYFFVVTAYNSAGLESSPSNEVSYTAP